MSIQILSQAAVTDKLAIIGKSAKALQADIHQVAVSTLDHCREHGDYRGALALVNCLPNGQRVKGLVAWFQNFSNGKLVFKADKASGGFAAELKKDRVNEDFNILAAMEVDYGTFTAEVAPKTMSLEAFVKSLESKADNDDVNSDGTPKVSREARAFAAKCVAVYRSTQSVQ